MSSESVEAYAKLQGESESCFVNDLPFVFGRKTDKSPKAFFDICMDKKDKTISREYAVLQYNNEKKTFVLEIKGKKGCFVNKTFYGKNEECYLKDGDAVTMVNCHFYFLLPQDPMDSQKLHETEDSSQEQQSRSNVKRDESSLEGNSKRQEVACSQ